jgi:hypothetical protein
MQATPREQRSRAYNAQRDFLAPRAALSKALDCALVNWPDGLVGVVCSYLRREWVAGLARYDDALHLSLFSSAAFEHGEADFAAGDDAGDARGFFKTIQPANFDRLGAYYARDSTSTSAAGADPALSCGLAREREFGDLVDFVYRAPGGSAAECLLTHNRLDLRTGEWTAGPPDRISVRARRLAARAAASASLWTPQLGRRGPSPQTRRPQRRRERRRRRHG